MVVMVMVAVMMIVAVSAQRNQTIVSIELRAEEGPEAIGSQESDEEDSNALESS